MSHNTRSSGTHAAHSADALAVYLAEISKYPLLSAEEETELVRRYRAGDESAIDQLICSNLRFVVSVARRYQNQNVALLDLIEEGNVGLMHAVRRFDPDR